MLERLKARLQRRQLDLFADFAEQSGRADVADKIHAAGAAVPLFQILVALAPFIIAFISGQPIDWAAVMKVITDLLLRSQPAPAPAA